MRYKICYGAYILNEIRENHCWCEDGKGRIIDLTAKQYDDSLSNIEILSPLYERYDRYKLRFYS